MADQLLRAEQRLSLTIGGFRRHKAAEKEVPLLIPERRRIDRGDQDDAKDDKAEDPLQRGDLEGKLFKGQCCLGH